MSGTTAAQTAAMQAQNTQAINDQISAYIRGVSQEVKQNIYSRTIATPGASNNQISIPLRNVGLVKGFIVEISGTLSNPGGTDDTLTNWNIANVLSNVSFFDLDNYQRINCAGWFLNMIGTAKEGFPHVAALLSSAYDTPIKYGSNFAVLGATPTVVAGGQGSFKMRYWVPLAYSKSDLRGAVFMGVVNATSYLQLTLNPNFAKATGTDGTLAVYQGGGTTIITSATIDVYQVYLDQLPRYNQGPNVGAPILPPIDTATQYRLVTTSLTGVTPGQDFPVPFSNFQQFLSLGVIYDQNGTLNAGGDINYFALAAANTYQLFKLSPNTQAMIERIRIMTDFPLGSYMFDFRDQPINTNQTGNMQLLINPISAAAGTNVLAGFESFALVNTILGAASLPAS